jgi:hypothetical protein
MGQRRSQDQGQRQNFAFGGHVGKCNGTSGQGNAKALTATDFGREYSMLITLENCSYYQ